MIYAQLPDASDPHVPHQVMLDMAYVDGMLAIDVVDRTEDNTTTTIKRREQASISVDAQALLLILYGMVYGDRHDQVRREQN